MLDKLKESYARKEEIHCKKFNQHNPSEEAYQDSVLELKLIYKEIEKAAKKEGKTVPVILWPKR